MKISGIYKIINKVNGKYYVGSTTNIKIRWKYHKVKLRENKHDNIHLQRSWNKYGENNFDFIIVEEIPEDKLLIVEQKYLDKCKENPEQNYNISYNSSAPMTGRIHSNLTKEKMSKWIRKKGKENPLFGIKRTEKDRIKMVLNHKNVSGINNPMFGKTISDDHKKKIGDAHRGENHYMFGKHPSKETRIRLSIAHRDNTIFSFKNIKTGEIFQGNSYDFSKEKNFLSNSVRKLVTKKRKSLCKWMLI